MINFKNLTKKFNEQVLFKQCSFAFPKEGIVGIVGPSGSGKTTLINILALLEDDYEGEYFLDSIKARDLPKAEKEELRSRVFGIIYQNHSLFLEQTVEENLLFLLKSRYQLVDQNLILKMNFFLKEFDLLKVVQTQAKYLSLGEQQRLSIIRTILLEPKVIIADEPTSALDEENSILFFEQLIKVSQGKLVIIISHNENLLKRYVDVLYEIRNAELMEIAFEKTHHLKERVTIREDKKPLSMPLKVLFQMGKSATKRKKKRYLFINVIMSISLLLIGTSIFLTTYLKDEIHHSYLSLIDGNSLIAESKEQNDQSPVYQGTERSDLIDLESDFKDDIKNIGVSYFADFVSFFKDDDQLVVSSTNYGKTLSSFHIENINHFLLIDDTNNYGFKIDLLNDDQIYLGLPYLDMRLFSESIRVQRSYDAINEYLNGNKVYVTFELSNVDWEYYDEQIFEVVGVREDSTSMIYHTNPLFNEVIYEEQMRIPVSFDFINEDPYPWFFKKTYNIELFSREDFYNKIVKTKYFSRFLFQYFSSEKLNIFLNQKTMMNYKDYLNFAKVSSKIQDYYLITSTYQVLGSVFLEGFASDFIVSSSMSSLDQSIDLLTNQTTLEANERISDPIGSFSSSFLNSNPLKFEPIKEKLSMDEIVISSALAKRIKFNLTHNEIFIAYNYQNIKNGSTFTKEFKKTILKVKGIIDNKEAILYHNSDWTFSFFVNNLKIDVLNVRVSGLVLKTETKITLDLVNKLNALFPKYDFYSPTLEMEKNMNMIFNWIILGLTLFGSICLLSSIVLLISVAFSLVTELKPDLSVFKSLGYSNFEITKYLLVSLLINQIPSLILSFFSFGLLSLGLIIEMKVSIGIKLVIPFLLAISAMIFITLLASVFSCLLIYFQLQKKSPIQIIKREF